MEFWRKKKEAAVELAGEESSQADSRSTALALRPIPGDALVLVPMRNAVLFPGVISPVTIGRESSVAAARAAAKGERQPLYFWRDNHGIEVDLVFEQGQRLHSVECKSGTTYAADWLGPARRWREFAGSEAADPVLVYGGHDSHALADHHLLSWQALGMST